MSEHDITIRIGAETVSLDEALRRSGANLTTFGRAATEAGQKATSLAEGEKKAGQEATVFSERMTKAAEAVGLLGAESSESILKVNAMGRAFADLRTATQSFGAAMVSMGTTLVAFKAIDFLKESADEAAQSQGAWNQLAATFRGNVAAFQATKDAIEQNSAAFARYGLTIGQVAAIVAQARGRGLSAETVLGNVNAIQDLSKALGTDFAGAVAAVTSGPRGVMQIGRALNLSLGQMNQLRAQLNAAGTNADQRAMDVLAAVERSRFAGQGGAAADTAAGRMVQFRTSLADLQETLGEALLPMLTNLASALTGIVQGVNTTLSAFGGLQGILGNKFLPGILAGLAAFKALHAIFGFFENLLKTKFISSLSQTTQQMDQADKTTQQYVKDLHDIPPDVDTTAKFIAAQAMATKDAYIANIEKLMGLHPVTRAQFVPATAAIKAYENQLNAIPHGEKTAATATGHITESATVNRLTLARGTTLHIPDEGLEVNRLTLAPHTTAHLPAEGLTVNRLTLASGTTVHLPDEGLEVNKLTLASGTTASIPGEGLTINRLNLAPGTTAHIPGEGLTVNKLTLAPGTTASIPGEGLTINRLTLAPGTTAHIPGEGLTVNKLTIAPGTTATIPGEGLTISKLTLAPGTTVKLPGEGLTVNQLNLASGTTVKLPGEGLTVNRLSLAPGTTVHIPDETLTVDKINVAPHTSVNMPQEGLTIHKITVPRGTPVSIPDEGLTVNKINVAPGTNVNLPNESLTMPVRLVGESAGKGKGDLSLAQEADKARAELQNELNADAPLSVTVKPKWISGASQDLTAGLGGGVAMAVTDMIVQNMQVQGGQQPTTPTTPTTPVGHHGQKPTAPTHPPSVQTKQIVSDPLLETKVDHLHGMSVHTGKDSWTNIANTPTVKVDGVVNTHSVDSNIAGTAATDIGLGVMQALIMGAVMRGFSGAQIGNLAGTLATNLGKLIIPQFVDWAGTGATPAPPGKKPRNTVDLQKQQTQREDEFINLMKQIGLVKNANVQKMLDQGQTIPPWRALVPTGQQIVSTLVTDIGTALKDKKLETTLGQDFLGVMEAAGEAAANQAKDAVGAGLSRALGRF